MISLSSAQLIAVVLPIAATLLGGWIVLRNHQNLKPWLSLSGGILLGLAFLDLLPEAFEHGATAGVAPATIGTAILGSILFFHILDKLFDFHGHEGHEHDHPEHKHHAVNAWARVSGMGFHSFLDGLAISGGFASSQRLGLLVTFAIMAHKLTDGMSTVTIMHARGGEGARERSKIALVGIIILPLLGLALGQFLKPSETAITLFLGILCGLFIHVPLSELLPQAHEAKASRVALALTVAGIVMMGVVTRLTAG